MEEKSHMSEEYTDNMFLSNMKGYREMRNQWRVPQHQVTFFNTIQQDGMRKVA